MSKLISVSLLVLLGAGCTGVYAPRFPQSIATALADEPMSRIETPNILLYYPNKRREQALRFLERVEGCVGYWRGQTRIRNGISEAKLALIMPELPFNNAFVQPRIAGYEDIGVIPTYNTLGFFTVEGGLPPDPAFIGCHEVTHYVHFQQIGGFAWFLNLVFGDIYSPQVGLDSWFDEGLAVYSETILQPGAGRLAWPYWNGVFAAGVAGRRINGGDLSEFNRVFDGGNHYLFGSQFVRFLAERYGESQLWKLIDVQGRSIWFTLWVNVRFWQAYDKSLSTLIDEFADDTAKRFPPVERPPDQHVIRDVGTNARYARARDGTEAFIADDLDRPAHIQIFAPDGRLILDRHLIDVVPPRDLKIGAPNTTGGLSFSGDGRHLYFTAQDLNATFEATRLIRLEVATGALTVVGSDLRGSGGSVSPDERHYLFTRAEGDRHDLIELDLQTGALRTVVTAAAQHYFNGPRYSPDGRRLVATGFDGQHFSVGVWAAADGRVLSSVPTAGGPTFDPSWIDDHRIVFLGSAPGSVGFQIYLWDLDTGATALVTHAPYLAFNPSGTADGRAVRFLNREGWRWTLDQVALPLPPPPFVPAAPPAGPPAGDTPPPLPPPPPPFVPALRPPGPPSPIAVKPIILSEEPYSGVDHLFVPQLRALTVQAVGRQGQLYGAALDGGDRLSFHRWLVFGFVQPATGAASSVHVSGGAGYSNQQLAPFTVSAFASRYAWLDVPMQPANSPATTSRDFTLQKQQRDARLSISRLFYGNPVQLSALVTEDYEPNDVTVAKALRRLAGPSLSASYTGAESTPYTGARRLAFVSGAISYFPHPWGTLGFDIVDLRGRLFATVPLPLSRRHTLSLGLRGRVLAGAPDDSPVLQVGGASGGFLLHRSTPTAAPEFTADFLPPGISFFETLRGYDDRAIATTRVAIADATYRYPVIIDWGSASTLGLLPAFFLRQLNFELFFSGAVDGRAATKHAAVGTAVGVDFALMIPWSLQYQLAQRLEDDRAQVHTLFLGLGL
jgi:hypothetical protein